MVATRRRRDAEVRRELSENLNDLSHRIIGCAIEVHRHLGPGLLEEIYEEALCEELRLQSLAFHRQYRVPVVYKGVQLKKDYVLDLLVEDLVIVECKATLEDHPVFRAQLLTQLRITNKQLGLLINFNKPVLKSGITRVANKTPE